MAFINAMYNYINKFINSDELINMLKKSERNYNLEEQKQVQELIEEIIKIKETLKNEIDSLEKEKLSSLYNMLGFQEDDEEIKEYKSEQETFLKEEKLYQSITKLLNNHPLIKKEIQKLSDQELLLLITKSISISSPFKITQNKWNDLVHLAITEDKREELWRLAFNYHQNNMDLTEIIDYFILKRDDYYLTELLSVARENIEIENLIHKLNDTEDKEFINRIIENAISFDIMTREEIHLLESYN